MQAPKLTIRALRPNEQRTRAIQLFREWDAVMTKHHGPLYYRVKGYSVH